MGLLNVNTVIITMLASLIGLIGTVVVYSMVATNRIQKSLDTHRQSVDAILAGMDEKGEYLNRRLDALQSDVSFIRGRLSIADEDLPEGSKVKFSPPDPPAPDVGPTPRLV